MGTDHHTLHTHYDNLKVARNAPPEVIRAAYKVLTQKYHPDKWPGTSDATRVMQLINHSYAVLTDPAQRAEHDAWIRAEELRQRNHAAEPQSPEAADAPAPAPATAPTSRQVSALDCHAQEAPAAPPAPADRAAPARSASHEPRLWAALAVALAVTALVLPLGGGIESSGSNSNLLSRALAQLSGTTAPPSAPGTQPHRQQPAHDQRITAVHPDARAVIASPDFVAWTRQSGPALRQEAARVLHGGTPEQVIDLLSRFKAQQKR